MKHHSVSQTCVCGLMYAADWRMGAQFTILVGEASSETLSAARAMSLPSSDTQGGKRYTSASHARARKQWNRQSTQILLRIRS